ncbi:hypothetical protein JOC33_001033 [Thalassobacillus pellis]|nr:hypothetical protein [Thalassobacillus pellis]
MAEMVQLQHPEGKQGANIRMDKIRDSPGMHLKLAEAE